MSKITDAEANATSLDGLVNDNALVPTLRNGPKPSWQYLVDGWTTEFDALIDNFEAQGDNAITSINADVVTVEAAKDSAISSIDSDLSAFDAYYQAAKDSLDDDVAEFTINSDAALADFELRASGSLSEFAQESAEAFNEFDLTLDQYKESRGFNTKGTFADGFTYELPNDVGIDASGNPWIYNGTLPFTVAAGTTPASPAYTQVAYSAAAQVSTNTSDTVQSFVDSFALKIFQTPTNGGLTEIQTRTVSGGEVYEVRKTSDNTLATIYSDDAGTTEIVQNGTDNKSGSDGVVEFYIADGDYYVEVASVRSYFNVTFNSVQYIFETISDLESGMSTVGYAPFYNLAKYKSVVFVKDTKSKHEILTPTDYGKTPDGFADRYVAGGYIARLLVDANMNASAWGVSTTNVSNDANLQAIINSLKNSNCSKIQFQSGTFNFQCFDEINIGRASVVLSDIENVDFIGGVATTFKSVTGGFGTDPFSLLRVSINTKNVEFKGIEFDGDYSNVPEFAGQTANVSSGVIIENWDFSTVASTQTSFPDFSIDNVVFCGCRFKNIGGGVTTRRKSNLKARGGYTSVTVKDCTFEDAQQSNNSVGADYGYKWLVTRNNFYTTIPLSDTVWTIAVDMSRGGIANEISYNRIDKYHYGMKCEYNLEGGVSGTEVENSEVSTMHNNNMTNLGHPTLDNGPGSSASGSYGIRMSGNNLVEYDNQIAGLYNAANIGAERRLITGVWSNHTGVEGTSHASDRGYVGGARVAVNHNSSSKTNSYVCKFKKIRDCDRGVILQAGGQALHNDIRRIQDAAIAMQIQDNTLANNNYIFDVDKASTGNGAIKGGPSSGATLKYWEVLDNTIDTVDGGAGTGVVMNGVFGAAFFSFRYRAGVMTNVATLENQELVSDVLSGDAVKVALTGNPSTRTILNSKNVKSLNAVDANTFEIEFLKPLPTASFQFSAIEPNKAGTINWINFGTTTNTLRLRSVDNTGTPVALPASIMVSIA